MHRAELCFASKIAESNEQPISDPEAKNQPMDNDEQLGFLRRKLAYETDSADLYEALGRGEALTVIDGRSGEAHLAEHIPGAVSFPHRTISAESTAVLDRSRVHVCYCDGIGCNASTKTALKLLELGFQVRELIGGLDWWKRDGYPTHGSNGRNRPHSVGGGNKSEIG